MSEKASRSGTDCSEQNNTINTQQTSVAPLLKIAVDFIWFTDEVFTIAAPSNAQNDRVYAPKSSRKKDVTAERLL